MYYSSNYSTALLHCTVFLQRSVLMHCTAATSAGFKQEPEDSPDLCFNDLSPCLGHSSILHTSSLLHPSTCGMFQTMEDKKDPNEEQGDVKTQVGQEHQEENTEEIEKNERFSVHCIIMVLTYSLKVVSAVYTVQSVVIQCIVQFSNAVWCSIQYLVFSV